MLYCFVDGSFWKKEQRGAWSYLIFRAEETRGLCSAGIVDIPTVNRAELMAAKRALERVREIKRPSDYVSIISDSKYVVMTFTHWVRSWERHGWKKFDKEEPKNLDLIKPIYDNSIDVRAEWRWTKGHNGNLFNEVVDRVARRASNTNSEIREHEVSLGRVLPQHLGRTLTFTDAGGDFGRMLRHKYLRT